MLVGGVCYLCVLALFRRARPPHKIGRVAAYYLVPLGLVGLPGLFLLLRVMLKWQAHGLQWNYTPVHQFLGIIRNMGFEIALFAFSGAIICALRRPRWAVFALCAVLPGILGLLALAVLVDVKPEFVLAVMPLCFFLAAACCVVPFTDLAPGLYRRVCVVALAMAVTCSQLPSTISYFTERGANDPRIPAKFVRKLAKPGDKFIGYVSGLDDYLGHRTYRLGEMYSQNARWKDGLEEVRTAQNRTWFILSFPRAGLPDALGDWLQKHAQLVKRWRAKRFDYLTRDIEVWLYDPAWPERNVRESHATTNPRPAGKEANP